jgi:hypothetical protein
MSEGDAAASALKLALNLAGIWTSIVFLLVSKSDRWIQASRTSGWNIAGKNSGAHQNERRTDKRQRIVGFDTIEQTRKAWEGAPEH